MRRDCSYRNKEEAADPMVTVQVTVTRTSPTTRAGTKRTTQLPTFYIDRNVQGIKYRDEDHLWRVVCHIVDPWHGAPHLQQYDTIKVSTDWGN